MASNKVLDSQPAGSILEPLAGTSVVSMPPDRIPKRVSVWTAVFVGLFCLLLASFPARNIDVWKHLADGRNLVRGVGDFSPTWLYDLAAYALYSVAGGSALAAVK